jgi:hypothetical protein
MKALDLLKEQLNDEHGKGVPERGSYRLTIIDNLEEAIAELEELLKPKSCKKCVHVRNITEFQGIECSLGVSIINPCDYDIVEEDFYCKHYEPK